MKNFLSIMFATLLLSLTGCGINNIPTYDEQVTAAWSNVLNQYQRRADLVPNLVETVKGYAAHEKEVLLEVVNARSKVSQMQLPEDILSNPTAMQNFQEAQSGLGGALSKLMLVVESYPDLKASQNFLTLQSQLEGTENRIAVARSDYINAVRLLNTEIRTFPGRWWHQWLYADIEKKQNFDAPASVQETPKVEF